MTNQTIKAVCDAGPIIHLDELNSLDLLSDFQEILLPNAVWREIIQHRPFALKRPGLSLIQCSTEYPAGEPLYTMCRTFSLDAGEMEALAIMEKNPMALFLTDDAAARLVAQQMGFRVHGTIGIIVRGIRRGMRTPEQVLSILREMPSKATLYIKSSLLEEVIDKIKNEFHI